MGKRFGRNKKRKLEDRLKYLEEELEWEKKNHAEIPHLKTDSICVSVLSKGNDRYRSAMSVGDIVRVEVKPSILAIEKIVDYRGLNEMISYPEVLAGEISKEMSEYINKAVPALLNHVKEKCE